MLTVHHLRQSQSERIVWLCEELGIDYRLKLYNRREDNMMAPDDYKALHPMGIAPVITDADLVLGESGAIADYIVAKFGNGRLVPAADSPDFPLHLYWYHFANATLMPNLLGKMVLGMAGAGNSQAVGFLDDRKRRANAMIESHLANHDYFGGDELTTADIMMFFPLTTMRNFSGDTLEGRPNLAAYLRRVGSRPAYRRAMEKAEPGAPVKLD